MTISGKDFSKLLPGAHAVPVEELTRQQGVRPIENVGDMRADLWDSDEELAEFLADVRASRPSNLECEPNGRLTLG